MSLTSNQAASTPPLTKSSEATTTGGVMSGVFSIGRMGIVMPPMHLGGLEETEGPHVVPVVMGVDDPAAITKAQELYLKATQEGGKAEG